MSDYQGLMPKVLYVCDGKKACNRSAFCYYNNHETDCSCFLTTTLRSAKNGPCNNPEEHPERFVKEVINGATIYYTEKLQEYV